MRNTDMQPYYVGGILLGACLVGMTLSNRSKNEELETKNAELQKSQAKLERDYTAFTNQYAQTHSPTNLTSQTEDTNTPTLSQRTPDAIRYAETLNQTQARGPK